MASELTLEQSDALQKSGSTLPLVDPKTDKVYVLVDEAVHLRAMEALKREEAQTVSAIREGLDDIEAGRSMSLKESQARTQAALEQFRK